MKAKTIVSVFPKPEWMDTISCDGKPCGGGCGSTPASVSNGNCKSDSCGDGKSCDFFGLLKWIAEKYSDRLEIKIADYSSLKTMKNSLDELNKILERNNEDLRVTLDNFELFFSQINPIIAVDNILAFVGKTPGEQDLREALHLFDADHEETLSTEAVA